MKKKWMTYRLVAFAIGLWGLILYRVFDAFSEPENKLTISNKKVVSKIDNPGKSKDEVLLLNYKDPFLKNTYRPKPSGALRGTGNNKASPIRKSKKVQLNKAITYQGLISNSNHIVAMLQIEGHNVLLKEKEHYQDLQLKKIYPDSLILIFQEQAFCINKQNQGL